MRWRLTVHRKGKWWLGNSILHHYVPNTNLKSSNFNETYQQFQVIQQSRTYGFG
jgi:hypothetical protein